MAALALLLVSFFAAALSSGSCLKEHLVVLCHGLSGSQDDLRYLGESLTSAGAAVYRSRANEMMRSFHGVKLGGSRLAEEVRELVSAGSYQSISFVGNSLGGLYARYAIRLLFNHSDATIAGLTPSRFLLIASPSLGVRNFTIVEDQGFSVPDILKRTVSQVLHRSGEDLFAFDASSLRSSLLYAMATEEPFLAPLRAFEARRLYANLNNDFVVPLGTAAFLHRDEVLRLRQLHSSSSGIVHTILTNRSESRGSLDVDPVDHMREELDALGWEKRIVHFPGLLPIAHNKICALNRRVYWILNDIFAEGKFVMDDASAWICSSGDLASELSRVEYEVSVTGD